MTLFAPRTPMPFPARLMAVGGFAVAALCAILALFVFPGGNYGGPGVDEGRGFGYWMSLIAIMTGLVLSLMRVQQTSTQVPGALGKLPHIGARGPRGAGAPAAPSQDTPR